MQGSVGPHQHDCEKVYKYYKTKVSIGESGHNRNDTEGNDDLDSKNKADNFDHQLGYVTGIQRWKVPTTGIYT